MSSILDALKKSERQHSLGRDLVYRNAAPNATPRLTRFAVAVLATLLLLALAIGALLFSLRDPAPPPLAGTTPEKTATVAEPAPVARTESVPPLDSLTHAPIQSTPPPEKPASTGVSASDTREVPWLSSLPLSFRSNLPPLAVNIHVYSPDASRRILYINNRQALQGKKIEAGVLVVEIVRDGVVLEFHGQRFKLPRPS